MGLCTVAGVTNRYDDTDADRPLIQARSPDALSYAAIADAAPRLPVTSIPFHQAQRLAIPYVIGVGSHVLGVPAKRLFLAMAVLLSVVILVTVAMLLDDLSVRGPPATLILAAVAWSPFGFRQYLTFPQLLVDLGFILGLTIVLRGLLRGNVASVMLGQALASLSRQTGLLIVPAVIVWVWRDRLVWPARRTAVKGTLCLAAAAIAGGIYVATSSLVVPFAVPGDNVDHLLGLFVWLGADPNPRDLALFLARGAMAFAMPVAMLLGVIGQRHPAGDRPAPVPLLLFTGACIWIQPFLGGPAITGGNGPRLLGLGLVPLFLVAGIALRDSEALGGGQAAQRLPVLLALVGLGSMHHLYSAPWLPTFENRLAFMCAFAVACLGVCATLRRDSRAAVPA